MAAPRVRIWSSTTLNLIRALNGHMIYFENVDGRVCILFPYLGRVLLGSTDIRVDKPANVRCEDDEVDYILKSLSMSFPGSPCGRRILFTAIAECGRFRAARRASPGASRAIISSRSFPVRPRRSVWWAGNGRPSALSARRRQTGRLKFSACRGRSDREPADRRRRGFSRDEAGRDDLVADARRGIRRLARARRSRGRSLRQRCRARSSPSAAPATTSPLQAPDTPKRNSAISSSMSMRALSPTCSSAAPPSQSPASCLPRP